MPPRVGTATVKPRVTRKAPVKVVETEIDQLSDQIGSLTVEDAQSAMRTVNDALSKLRTAAKDSTTNTSQDTNALGKLVLNASKALDFLRVKRAGSALNTERAASSLCAVLVELKMLSEACTELVKITAAIKRLYGCPTPLESCDSKPAASSSGLTELVNFPLPVDSKSNDLSLADICLLVVQTQSQAINLILRTTRPSEWKNRLPQMTTRLGSKQAAPLLRLDTTLESIFATIVRHTNNIDSSSSKADYDPDSLLHLRLFGVTCVLATPVFSQKSSAAELTSRCNAFWDQLRRFFGLYIRATTQLQRKTSIKSLVTIVSEVFGEVISRHPILLQGPSLETVFADLEQHATAVNDIELAETVRAHRQDAESAEGVVSSIEAKFERIARLLDQQRKLNAKNDGLSVLEANFASINAGIVGPELEVLRGACYKLYKHICSAEEKDRSGQPVLRRALEVMFDAVHQRNAQDTCAAEVRGGALDSAIVLSRQSETTLGKANNERLDACLALFGLDAGSLRSEDAKVSSADLPLCKSLASAYYNAGIAVQRSHADDVSGSANALPLFERACLLGAITNRLENEPAMVRRYIAYAHSLESVGRAEEAAIACLKGIRCEVARVGLSEGGTGHVSPELNALVTNYTRLSVFSPDSTFLEISLHDKVPQCSRPMMEHMLEVQFQFLERKVHKSKHARLCLSLMDRLQITSTEDNLFRPQALKLYIQSLQPSSIEDLDTTDSADLNKTTDKAFNSVRRPASQLAQVSLAIRSFTGNKDSSPNEQLERFNTDIRTSLDVLRRTSKEVAQSVDQVPARPRKNSADRAKQSPAIKRTPAAPSTTAKQPVVTSPCFLRSYLYYQLRLASSLANACAMTTLSIELVDIAYCLSHKGSEDWAEICLKAVPMDLAFEQVQVRTTWQQRIEQVLQGNSSISSVEKAEAWLGLASLAIADGNLSLARTHFQSATNAFQDPNDKSKKDLSLDARWPKSDISLKAYVISSKIKALEGDLNGGIEHGLTAVRQATSILHTFMRRTTVAIPSQDVFTASEDGRPHIQLLMDSVLLLPKPDKLRLLDVFVSLCDACLHTSRLCAARGSVKMAFFLLDQAKLYTTRLPCSLYNARIELAATTLRKTTSRDPEMLDPLKDLASGLPSFAKRERLELLMTQFESSIRSLEASEARRILPTIQGNSPSPINKRSSLAAKTSKEASTCVPMLWLTKAEILLDILSKPVQGHLFDEFLARRKLPSLAKSDTAEVAGHFSKTALTRVEESFDKDPLLGLLKDAVAFTLVNDGSVRHTTATKARKAQSLEVESLFGQLSKIIASDRNALSIPVHQSLHSTFAQIGLLASSLDCGSASLELLTNSFDITANTTTHRELAESIALKLRMSREPPTESIWPSSICSPAKSEGQQAHLKYWQGLIMDPLTKPAAQKSEHSSKLLQRSKTISLSLDPAQNRLTVICHFYDQQQYLVSLPMDRLARREGEEEELDFHSAREELDSIIASTNASCQQARHISTKEDRQQWWESRDELDARLKQLLENIEKRWLGPFKALLTSLALPSASALRSFGTDVQTVLKPYFHRTKNARQPMLSSEALSALYLMSSDMPEEDYEDWLHYAMEGLQFAGFQINYEEADTDAVIVDLRRVLEEAKRPAKKEAPEHIFLVLDKHTQAFPWESLPCFINMSMSRVPSASFLRHMAAFRETDFECRPSSDSVHVSDSTCLNSSSAYFLLNPSGDLVKTQETFQGWLEGHKTWTGLVGRRPMELELKNQLSENDLFIYFGHGGAEQYIRSQTLRGLPRCAAAFLWGCSSGTLHDMGQYDPHGTPLHYLHAGCPTLVANLWDVTDKDIDKFTKSAFTKLGLDDVEPSAAVPSGMTIPAAIASSRDVCTMRFLNGAAPVVYGLPLRCRPKI